MQKKKWVTVLLAVLISLIGILTAHSEAIVDSNLNISIPCLQVGTTYFQCDLLKYDNPAESTGYYLQLSGNVMPTGDDGNCASVDTNLKITFPTIDVFGAKYSATLDYYPNALDPNGFYWALGSATLKTSPTPTTTLITSYMATLHAQTISQFLTDEDAISASATGGALSSGHLKKSKSNYESHIQIFVESSLAYVQAASKTMPIDINAIIQLFNTYKDSDKSYASTYYLSVPWIPTVSIRYTIIDMISADLDAMYSLVIQYIKII